MGGSAARTGRALALVLVGTLVVLVAALWRDAGAGRPMSVVDEHVHLDTHVRVHQGGYPSRGDEMTMAVVREWACGVGHEGGAALAPCDHPDLGPQSLPSGELTTGYIHYPTYFLAAEGYRWLAERAGGGGSFVDTYRHFAALVTALGLLVCLLAGWSLGFRGAALLAATLAPSAAAAILLYGTVANPQSSGVLLGALIAWAGLHWTSTGRGFWWLAAATTVAACVAVVQSLPAGIFMLATLAALLLRHAGWRVPGPWQPHWWQLGVLSVVVVAPVVAFGRWIEDRATITDAEIFAFAAIDSWTDVLPGAVAELTTLHSPWVVSVALSADEDAPLVQHLLRAGIQGLPAWITLLVVGMLVVVAGRAVLGHWRLRRSERSGAARSGSAPEEREPRAVPLVGLLALSALAAVMLYPPALRLANGITMGFDHAVVARYSISFTPALVWLFLVACRDRPVPTRLLAGMSTAGTALLALAIW